MKFRTGTVVDVCGEWALLALVDVRKCALIDIKSGNRWEDPIEIGDPDEITRAEIRKMCGGREHSITIPKML